MIGNVVFDVNGVSEFKVRKYTEMRLSQGENIPF